MMLPSFVTAVDLQSLGEVSVLVSNEGEQQRNQGVREGLSLVLVKLIGKQEVLQSATAQSIINQGPSYLIQYSYDTFTETNSNSYEEQEFNSLLKQEYLSQNSQRDNMQSTKDLKILKLQFDQQILLKKLQEGGAAIWDTNRPEVMFWWASEEQGVRKILNEGDQSKSRAAFDFFANQRALPVKFPLMDIKDQGLVSTSDIWGAYGDALLNANKRYNVNTWVQGRHYYSQGEWFASWEVHVLGTVKAFKSQSADLLSLQKAVVGTIAKVLSDEYSVVAGKNSSEIYISVSDIDSLEDFTQLNAYLSNLFVVKNVELRNIKGNQLSVKLYLKDDFEKFRKLIDLDKKLFEIINSESAGEVYNSSSNKTATDSVTNISIKNHTRPNISQSQNSTDTSMQVPESDIVNNPVKNADESEIIYIQYRWADK